MRSWSYFENETLIGNNVTFLKNHVDNKKGGFIPPFQNSIYLTNVLNDFLFSCKTNSS